MLNGKEIAASVDEQETLMLELASGEYDREALAAWIKNHVRLLE